MIKNKFILLSAALILFMSMGMTAKAVAANCPTCAMYGTATPLVTHGVNEGHFTEYHTAQYSENGVLYTEQCTVACRVDKVYWVCNNGHGTVYTRRHVVKDHSCSHCADLDYYE